MRNVEVFYPGWVKKALSFTIDDGNMKYDSMLLDILKPAGIKGTFNLCSNLHKGRELETKDFYVGYEIANHCKHHPLVNLDSDDLVLSDEPFSEETADPKKMYKVDGNEGFYWRMQPNGWRQMVFEGEYMRFAKESLDELNAIFGDGAVRDYVWPYCEQKNAAVREFVRGTHRSVRKTGCTLDTTGFALPADRYAWSYNADHSNLLQLMEKYESYPDDGELKFFAFGVHSIDFERWNKWDDLRAFADRYGNRPHTFWYASIGEIFDYEDAVSMLRITESAVENTSSLTVYLAVDGVRTLLEPYTIVNI